MTIDSNPNVHPGQHVKEAIIGASNRPIRNTLSGRDMVELNEVERFFEDGRMAFICQSPARNDTATDEQLTVESESTDNCVYGHIESSGYSMNSFFSDFCGLIIYSCAQVARVELVLVRQRPFRAKSGRPATDKGFQKEIRPFWVASTRPINQRIGEPRIAFAPVFYCCRRTVGAWDYRHPPSCTLC